MLSYLPIVGSYFSKTNTIDDVENFLRSARDIERALIRGLMTSTESVISVIFPMQYSYDQKESVYQLNAWVDFLEKQGIELTPTQAKRREVRIRFRVDRYLEEFVMKFASMLHKIYTDLMLKNKFLMIHAYPLMQHLLWSYNIKINQEDESLFVHMIYENRTVNFSEDLAELENHLMQLYASDMELGDQLRRIGNLPMNDSFLNQIEELKTTKDIRRYYTSLTNAEIQRNLKKKSLEAEKAMEEEKFFRDLVMNPSFKEKCKNRNEETVCLYKPLSTDDWCDIEEKNYYDAEDQDGTFTRCFDIMELLQHFETQLKTTKYGNPYPQAPSDWNNRKVFKVEQLLEIYKRAKDLEVNEDFPTFRDLISAMLNGKLHVRDGLDWTNDERMSVIEALEL